MKLNYLRNIHIRYLTCTMGVGAEFFPHLEEVIPCEGTYGTLTGTHHVDLIHKAGRFFNSTGDLCANHEEVREWS